MIQNRRKLTTSGPTPIPVQSSSEQGIADYSKAIELDPTQANFCGHRGNACRGIGDLDQAIADFDEAIRRSPSDVQLYNNRGRAYFDKGETDQAIADFDKAIQIDSRSAFAYNSRGNAYRRSSNLDQALSDYDKAVEIDPSYANAYFNRGIVHYLMGSNPKAVADLETYLRLKPDADDRDAVEQIISTLERVSMNGERERLSHAVIRAIARTAAATPTTCRRVRCSLMIRRAIMAVTAG